MNTQLKSEGLRRCKHASSYFRGNYNKYGKYQWDIKYYGFESEYEVEAARLYVLGEHVQVGKRTSNGNTLYGFDSLNEVIGRKVESHLDGRSAGWLVIDTELTEAELVKVDEYIENSMKGLDAFLQSERAYLESQIIELGGKSEGE